MKPTAIIATAFATALMATSQAAYITGTVNIALQSDAVFTFNTTTNAITFGPGANAKVNSVGTADYFASGILGEPVHYNSFNYGNSPGPVNVSPLWYTTNSALASFNLLSITSILESPTGASVTLEGTGLAYLDGFSPTEGTWSFAATRLGSGSTATFNWSSNNYSEGGDEVPDGGMTLVLLGLSTLGLGVARKVCVRR